jgi:threonine dehydrogenase-like Zn-dependent dehydrogenase
VLAAKRLGAERIVALSRNPQRRLAWRPGASPDLHSGADDRRARGSIDPGAVFDLETDLDHIGDAYRAMDERRAIKSLIRVGSL